METYLRIILISLIFFSISCKPCERLHKKCPPKIHDSLIIIETITDDPNYTIPDSLFWQFVLECDSNYNVILRAFNEVNTGINTQVKFKDTIVYIEDKAAKKQLIISLKAQTDSIETLNRTIEKMRNQVMKIYIDKEVEVYKSRKFFIYGTIGFLCCIIALLVYIVVRFKKAWLKTALNRLKI